MALSSEELKQVVEEVQRLIRSGTTLQSGVVRAVNFQEQLGGGRIAFVDVQNFTDLSIFRDIQIDQPLNHQYIPVVGQQVMLLRVGDFFTRVLMELAEQPFGATTEPGEILIEGGGGGFFYANNSGDIVLCDDVMSNLIELLSSIGISMTGDSLSINIKTVGKIKITPKSEELGTEEKIEFEKIKPTGTPTKIVITNDKIEIESKGVTIGRFEDSPRGGSVVSFSPIVGDYSIDILTGTPIPRSGTIEETIFPTPAP